LRNLLVTRGIVVLGVSTFVLKRSWLSEIEELEDASAARRAPAKFLEGKCTDFSREWSEKKSDISQKNSGWVMK
jgi:hypothetical protein